MKSDQQQDIDSRGYQQDYLAANPEMNSVAGRERKANTMLMVLQKALKERLADCDLLNLGCSTGIIDEFLAGHVRTAIGVDIDAPAVALANSRRRAVNLRFQVDDAMSLGFAAGSFDIVICSQVYEHVPDAKRMMQEIDRVLRPGGLCYFAATNRWVVMEKHYHLPFLSWVPPPLANIYVRILGKSDAYYERHLGYRPLLRLVAPFRVQDYTQAIIDHPDAFAASYMFPSRRQQQVAGFVYRHLRGLFPGFIWLLWKR